MELLAAKLLVRSLLGRLEQKPTFFELPSGRVSSDEVTALHVLCDDAPDSATAPKHLAVSSKPPIKLSDAAFKRKGPARERLRICLDFGTAMSKAWATGESAAETLPLLIGKPAGIGDTLAVPSSIYIGDNGRIFLGSDAEKQHRANLRPNRARFNNLKRLLSEEQVGTDLSSLPVLPGVDPTDSGLTRGDLLVLYLAWLTDLSEKALTEAYAVSELGKTAPDSLRAVARRFAIPCFESADDDQSGGKQRAEWVKALMEDALLRAQILADTLTDRWKGLEAKELAEIMQQLRHVDVSPLRDLLTADAAIREPIAAGASRFDSAFGEVDEPSAIPRRRLLLVVDAGAGTTDLALFQAITPRGKTETHYALLRHSVRMNRIAGNAVDAVLRKIVLRSCDIDPYTGYPRSKEDFDYMQSDLDSQIRDIKQVLFETGTVKVELKPNLQGVVDVTSLQEDPDFAKFQADLIEARRNTLANSFSADALASLQNAGTQIVHVLLTGGSSKLPIMRALASGRENVSGAVFEFRPLDHLPGWIETLPREAAERLSTVYPQCAVAIGGSVADLPVEINDLDSAIAGPRAGERRLERFPTQGV